MTFSLEDLAGALALGFWLGVVTMLIAVRRARVRRALKLEK